VKKVFEYYEGQNRRLNPGGRHKPAFLPVRSRVN